MRFRRKKGIIEKQDGVSSVFFRRGGRVVTKRKTTIGILFATLVAAILSLFLFPRPTAHAATSGFSTGEVNNLVVFVRFDGEEEFVSEEYMTVMDEMYNTSAVSVKQYFKEVSLNKLTLNTHFLMPENTTAVSVEVSHPREYYMPYDFLRNPEGYREQKVGGKEHIDRFYREQQLIREVLRSVQIPEDVVLDGNGDGLVDSFSLMVSGEVENDEWSDLLWPHMHSLYSFDAKLLSSYYVPTDYWMQNEKPTDDGLSIHDGLEFEDYNFLSSGTIMKERLDGEYADYGRIGVICHELMHTLGAMDYYSYETEESDYHAVGELDIMGTTDSMPQYPLSYQRRQMGWLEDDKNIVSVSAGGTYTLYPVTDTSRKIKAYKIKMIDYEQVGQYFMIEVRSNKGTFDGDLSSSGLIVYRINEAEKGTGNMYGNDEVFVYRTKHAKYNAQGKSTDVTIDKGSHKEAVSYAIFGEKQNDQTINPYVPSTNVTSYGLTGTSKTLSAEYPDLIYYRGMEDVSYEDRNSGLAVEDITVNADGSVTFCLNFDGDNGSGEAEQVVPVSGYPDVYQRTDDSISIKYAVPNYNDVAYTVVADADQVLSQERVYAVVSRYMQDGFLPEGVRGVSQTVLQNPLLEYYGKVGGLLPDTAYKCYSLIIRDNTLSTAFFVERMVRTLAEGSTAEIHTTAYDTILWNDGSKVINGNTARVISIDKGVINLAVKTECADAWCFYAVLPQGAETPTVDQVLYGTAGGLQATAVSAFRMAPNAETSHEIVLEINRKYDVYLVLRTPSGVSELKKISVNTAGSTKADTGINCKTLGCATGGSMGMVGAAVFTCLSAVLLFKRKEAR